VRGVDSLYAGVGEAGVCFFDGAGAVVAGGEVDGAGEVFEDVAFETEGGAVDGGEADAKVVGEAAEEEASEAALAKVAGEAGGRGVVVFEEGGVAVDVLAEAFAEDELGLRDLDAGVDLGAGCVLDAVVGPEVLGAVRDLDGLEGALAGVGAGEGDVAGGVPVLGEDDVGEPGGDGVDSGDDGVAVRNGEGTAGEEVALHVDDQKRVCGGEPKSHYLIVRRGDGFGDSP
jgi:hypothetical protein